MAALALAAFAPAASASGVCSDFDPGGNRLVPSVDQDGAYIMIYVGFFGLSSDGPEDDASGLSWGTYEVGYSPSNCP